MRTVISKSWDFRTYKIQAKCKCSECGKPINKTFSFELREDVSPQKENWTELEERKKKWLSEAHVCNSCKCKKIKQERKDITSDFKDLFLVLRDLQQQIQKLQNHKENVIKNLRKSLVDKILVDIGNEEWVINSISGQLDAAFELTCYRINKKKPWLRTDDYKFFCFPIKDEKLPYKQNSLENCIITNETLRSRRELLTKGD